MTTRLRLIVSGIFAVVAGVFMWILFPDLGLGTGYEAVPAAAAGAFAVAYPFAPRIANHAVRASTPIHGMFAGLLITVGSYVAGSMLYILITAFTAPAVEATFLEAMWLTVVFSTVAPFMGFTILLYALPAGALTGSLLYLYVRLRENKAV